MATGDRKEPGRAGSRDVDDLKARLGLKVPRREPAPPPPAPPPPAPTESAALDPTVVTQPPMGFPEITQPLSRSDVLARADVQRAESRARAAAIPPPWVEEAPPPPKSNWQRWGRSAVTALVVAGMGAIIGYVFGKGSSRSALLSGVKADAGRIADTLKSAFSQVEEVASYLDPTFAEARKQQKDLPPIRGVLRATVDWDGLEAMAKFEVPKDLEGVFDTGFFKLLGGARGKMFAAFLVDFQRLARGVRDHVLRTKAGRAQLEADVKMGAATPRAYAVVTQSLPTLERGEVVLLRGRRTVKQGKEDEAVVLDVARRSAPSEPIAVPETAVVILNAPGLIKAGSALLDEYNRRMREIAEVAQRLLEARISVLALVDKVAGTKT